MNIYMVLTAALMVLPGISLYAQKPDSPMNDKNAVDYRYRTWLGELPHYSDSVRFRDKVYIMMSAAPQAVWTPQGLFGTSQVQSHGAITLGYRFTPVHYLEIEPSYSGRYTPWRDGAKASEVHPIWGADVNYLLNISSFAVRNARFNKVEALLVTGLSFRYDKCPLIGLDAGIRVQYNIGYNLGISMEPRLGAYVSTGGEPRFATVPSLNFGITARFTSPDRFGWNTSVPLALKTNLLYDAVGALNLGVEVPIDRRWSVAAEWLCPWWTNDRRKYCFQIMQGTLEGRFWFGKGSRRCKDSSSENGVRTGVLGEQDEAKELLTGFFVGLSASAGVYDVMLKESKGFQGEFLSAGVVAGYAHRANRSGSLRMEYEIGVGYIGSEYRKYFWDGFDYTLVAPSPQSWRTAMFAPTMLKVSLVYALNFKTRGGR